MLFSRLLFLPLLVAAMPVVAQPAQPNEGAINQGPALLIERDIEYARADGQSLKLDIYRMSPAPSASPVVIWIHGEGAMNANRITPAAGLIQRSGDSVAVASIQYRTDGSTAEQLADAKAAVRWIKDNAAMHNFDPERIAVFGFGDGARLAALLGTTADVAEFETAGGTSSRVQAVIALAGPVASGEPSAVDYVTADDAPTLLLHGTADAEVSSQESQALVSALRVAGINAQLEMPMAVAHDQGQLLSPLAMQGVARFINQQLWGQQGGGGLSSFVATPADSFVDPVALDIGGTFYKLYPTNVRGPESFASYRIYFPPGYAENPNRRYPVIYFLHGRSVDSKRTVDAGYVARVDAAIRSGVMPPTIIVLPQGLNRGWYLDTEDGQFPMESVLVRDLIPHIDATYRTVASRAGRAIEGHSMGGYGALHIGFKFPELFTAVTGNSPALVENVTDAMGSQEYWISQAPATLAAANLAAVREQHIRIIVGTRDGLIEVGEKLSNDLTALGVEHEFTPVLEAPHNIDQLLLYEDFDRMAVYGDLFADFANP